MELLDYGFNNYKIEILKTKNETLKEIKLEKATSPKISIVPFNDVAIFSKKNEGSKKYKYDIEITNDKLPLKKGDTVGKIIVYYDSKKVKEELLTVKEDVDKLSYIELFKNTLIDMLVGNINFDQS